MTYAFRFSDWTPLGHWAEDMTGCLGNVGTWNIHGASGVAKLNENWPSGLYVSASRRCGSCIGLSLRYDICLVKQDCKGKQIWDDLPSFLLSSIDLPGFFICRSIYHVWWNVYTYDGFEDKLEQITCNTAILFFTILYLEVVLGLEYLQKFYHWEKIMSFIECTLW